MKRFVFDVAKHEEYGELGLRPKWYPTGDPLSGMAAAHDILEHFPKDDGSTEGELMALGASIFIRGDGGWSSKYRRYDSVRDPAADIPQVWGYMLDRENRTTLKPCGLSRDSFGVETGRAIVAEGMRELRHQYEDADSQPDAETRERMARWIARGYAKAQRRYSRVIGGACAVASLFMTIERECDEALKRADEGMQLSVYVNALRCGCRVECDYPNSFA